MYPNLSYILHDLFGTQRDNIFSIIQTFGLFLALGVITAAWMLRIDMKRRTRLGQFTPSVEERTIGGGASTGDYIGAGLVGFLLGWKLPALIAGVDVAPPDYILSGAGTPIWGLLVAVLFCVFTWWQGAQQQKKLGARKTVSVTVEPWERTTDIAIVAALSGIVGAKIFGILEVPPGSFAAFFHQFFSGQGLAIYGGLIGGFLGVWWYMRKHNLAFWPMADAIAPGMLVGVGVGRMGCQLSGDGDWGIVNNKPVPSNWILPDWAWSFRYPHNVIDEGVHIPGCMAQHCSILAEPVYPTPLYEIVLLIGLGLLLWSIRKWAGQWPGLLMGLYLVANGVERFFIEKIRVNATYDLFGYHPTQAEIISVISILIGVGLCLWTYNKGRRPYPQWV